MSHAVKTIDSNSVRIPASSMWSKIPAIGFVLGIVLIVATFFLAGNDHKQFYFSYTTSFLFWLSLALFGFFFTIVQFATRAGWSVLVRRFAETMMMTLPVFALLFIPIYLGRHELFHWTHSDAVATDTILKGKSPYLNEGFWTIRSIFYFVVWSLGAMFFYKNSTAQDTTKNHELTYKMQMRSYPLLALFVLTITFASFDWIMSLDPHWYSTMFGVYYFSGAVVGGFAFLTLLLLAASRSGILGKLVTIEHFHDLGKLLFGFIVFWAYIGFCQYFLIWYANIPEETIFYSHRYHHGWGMVSVFLALGHFVVPFLFLLSRHLKRNPKTLAIGALWMVFMHFVDIYWLVMPTLHHEHFSPQPADLTALLGVGGIMIGTFGFWLKKNAVVPVGDPRLSESLSFENM